MISAHSGRQMWRIGSRLSPRSDVEVLLIVALPMCQARSVVGRGGDSGAVRILTDHASHLPGMSRVHFLRVKCHVRFCVQSDGRWEGDRPDGVTAQRCGLPAGPKTLAVPTGPLSSLLARLRCTACSAPQPLAGVSQGKFGVPRVSGETVGTPPVPS